MLTLYNALLLPLRLALGAWSRIAVVLGQDPSEWRERLARRLPAIAPRGIWIHGASVGEARIVSVLARRLRSVGAGRPLAVSAYTRTGRRQLPAAPLADASFFLAADFPGPIGRLVDAVDPALVVLVETELWPNLLSALYRRGTPVVLINGRLSAGRMGHYRRLTGLYRPLLAGLERVGARTDEDAARFVELGVPPRAVAVTGNVKYDLPAPPATDLAAWRGRLGLGDDDPLFVAGSTAQGEDLPVLEAFERARARVPALRLLIAPRHPERFRAVGELIASRGHRLARLAARETVAGGGWQVLLIDTVGELAQLYGLASVAFVGGSLVPVGGHNLLEPVAAGAPVLFGPHTANVEEMAAGLIDSGAAGRIAGAGELATRVADLIEDDAERRRWITAGRSVLTANRGALDRSVALIRDVLEPAR